MKTPYFLFRQKSMTPNEFKQFQLAYGYYKGIREQMKETFDCEVVNSKMDGTIANGCVSSIVAEKSVTIIINKKKWKVFPAIAVISGSSVKERPVRTMYFPAFVFKRNEKTAIYLTQRFAGEKKYVKKFKKNKESSFFMNDCKTAIHCLKAEFSALKKHGKKFIEMLGKPVEGLFSLLAFTPADKTYLPERIIKKQDREMYEQDLEKRQPLINALCTITKAGWGFALRRQPDIIYRACLITMDRATGMEKYANDPVGLKMYLEKNPGLSLSYAPGAGNTIIKTLEN